MANGDTIIEVKNLLAEKGAIKTQTALRLSLEMQSQMYEKLTDEIKNRIELEEKVRRIEGSSIVLWVEKNRKLSVLILVIYLLLNSVVDVKAIVLTALGYK